MDYYERMRIKTVLWPLLFSFSLGMGAQAASPADPVSKSSALDGALFYQLLLAELNARSEEPGTAFSLTLDAARKTNDPAVFKRAVQLALQARSGGSALQAAQAWSQAIPASREANQFVLQILLGLNRTAEAVEPIKRAITLAPLPERREVIGSIPAQFDRVGDNQVAATTVQKALSGWLNDRDVGASAWASVGRVWLQANDKSAAIQAAAKGLALDVKAEHPALLALSMMNPELPQAESLVKQHLPHARPEFRMAYIKVLLGAQREDDVKTELQSIRTQFPDYADAWLIDGALALQANQLESADQQLQHYLRLVDAKPADQLAPETKRGRSQAFFSLAQIAQLRKDFKAAEAWLQRIDNPGDVLRAQLRRATVIAKLGRVDEALGLIQAQAETSEDDARLKRSAEIQLLRDQKLFDRARTSLKTSIAQFPDDLDLVYDLAMVEEKLGDLVQMEQLLRKLMAAKPEDPHAYNALGYSLADRGMRLPEAKQLISKALELSPKDPFITDSLGWAEFRSGNKEEALRLLQGAFKDKPDAEIATHLGEVLWSVQRQQEAIQMFREALKLNPDNETLTETVQRLRIPL